MLEILFTTKPTVAYLSSIGFSLGYVLFTVFFLGLIGLIRLMCTK